MHGEDVQWTTRWLRMRGRGHTDALIPFPSHSPGETTTIRKPEGGAIKDVPMSTARVSDGTGSVTLQLVGADECAPAALCPGDTYALRGGLFTTERGGRQRPARGTERPAGTDGLPDRAGRGYARHVGGPV